MKRTHLNFVVDAAAFAIFVFLVATGVIMEFLLPAGGGHSMTIWGLDRHEWCDVHFWLSVGFLTACAFHLYLHWKWIFAVLRGRQREGSGVRLGLGLLGLTALLAIAAAPILSPVERTENSRIGVEPRWGLSAEAEALQGSTALKQVIEETGVSLEFLLRELDLPPDVSLDDRLGQLARENGFSVAEVREVAERGLDEEVSVVSEIALPQLGSGDRPTTVVENEHDEDHELRPAGSADIRGSMTLGEVVELGVPLQELLRSLGLPAGTPTSERLGRLGRTYGFSITEVRDLAETYR